MVRRSRSRKNTNEPEEPITILVWRQMQPFGYKRVIRRIRISGSLVQPPHHICVIFWGGGSDDHPNVKYVNLVIASINEVRETHDGWFPIRIERLERLRSP